MGSKTSIEVSKENPTKSYEIKQENLRNKQFSVEKERDEEKEKEEKDEEKEKDLEQEKDEEKEEEEKDEEQQELEEVTVEVMFLMCLRTFLPRHLIPPKPILINKIFKIAFEEQYRKIFCSCSSSHNFVGLELI